jgi:undecaprenyl-diphosphatase
VSLIHLLQAAVLGVVEGATEFIPVSSTGHLILAQNLMRLTGRKQDAFTVFIQLGAILAVVWLYREKIIRLVSRWRSAPEGRRLLANLVIGTLPAVAIGLPTKNWVESHFFRPLPVALALALGGLAIMAVERWRRQSTVLSMDDIPLKIALWVGIVQVLSIVFPGVSRSGATIMGGLAFGLSRVAATEFSFFLAIPAMLGASLVALAGARDVITAGDVPIFAVGFIVSFVVALLVIKRLVAFVSRNSFVPFAWYRIIFGAALLVLLALSIRIF